jgi:hypothetical protein
MIRFAIGLALLCILSGSVGRAETSETSIAPLIACCSGDLREAIVQLAGDSAQVCMFTAQDAEARDYHSANRQAFECRGAVAFVYCDQAIDPGTCLWKQRLENHGVRGRYVETEGRCASRARVLHQIHDVLVELFPHEQQQFDERLQVALLRLVEVAPPNRVVANP